MNGLAQVTTAALLMAVGGHALVLAQGGKTPTYPVVPLIVEIEDTLSTGDPARIVGDESPYENGADGTAASIDKYGNLIISFGRPVHFDYTAKLSGSGGVTSGAADHSYVSTLPQSSRQPLQNLGEFQSQCIKLNWQYDVPGGMLRHGFNRGFDLSVPDDTSYAVVTRTGSDTWEVEPVAATCGLYANPVNPAAVALVFAQVSSKGKWVVTEYGRYSLPFRLTLTRK